MQTTLDAFIDKNARTVFEWLELIVMEELPLKHCEKPLVRKIASGADLEKIHVPGGDWS